MSRGGRGQGVVIEDGVRIGVYTYIGSGLGLWGEGGSGGGS